MPNLVGIGNSQVPTNAMLGGMAYQDPDNAILKGVEIESISKIKAQLNISPTANNENSVFVYNTANDSDGGAWRHRTQHTSWYNEEPSQYRGHRKEFPSVAVIVTDTNEVAIYDGDDPNLSMWMRFVAFSGGGGMEPNYVLQYSSSAYRVCALNGILVIGQGSSGDNWGNPIVNFISEEIERADPHTTEGGRWSGNIASRNGYNSSAAEGYVNQGKGFVIVNSRIRSLAMKVLDNAMIDPRTGLPIPTIAYSTYSGISVITANSDASAPRKVNDITASAGGSYSVSNYVDITDSGHLIFEQDGSNGRSVFFTPVPISDTTSTTNDGSITDKVILKPYTNTTAANHPRFNEELSTNQGISYGIAMKGPDHALLSHAGKVTLVKPNFDSPEKGMTAYITKDFNTGWMYGGCRNVWLAETDDSAIDNISKISNGSFTSNINGWSSNANASLSNPSGTLRVTQTTSGSWQGSTARIDMGTNFVVGKTYAVCYQIRSGGTSGNYSQGFGSRIQKYSGGSISWHSNYTYTYSQTTSDPGSSWVYVSWTFTAEATQYGLEFYNWYGVQNSYFELDEVNVREAVADHAYIQATNSQNQKNSLGNGLRIKGTAITKAHIYPGSELVYYTGFASGNNLWQEHTSYLDFGTDNCYMSIWAYGGGNGQCLIVKERPDVDAHGAMMIFQDSNVYKFYFRCNGQSSWGTVTTNVEFGTHWVHCYLVRRGSNVEAYCNGIYQGNASFSGTNGNGGSVAAEVAVGSRVIGSFQTPHSGRLALAKIGHGAPTEEDIQKIYTDERKLFAPNAKCTLYGSSDEIKTMSYDKSTDILNLGTSQGRTDFIGLNRINNTTGSVQTALSAAGGLIAEAS